MAGLEFDTMTGELSIDASADGHSGTWLSMHCAAWMAVDLRPMWWPGVKRGTDVVVNGEPGVRGRQRRATATPHSIPFILSGEADPSGNPAGDCSMDLDALFEAQLAQLAANVAALSVILAAPDNDDGTRAASLAMPGGLGTRTGDIHVLTFTDGSDVDILIVGTLDISIDMGALT